MPSLHPSFFAHHHILPPVVHQCIPPTTLRPSTWAQVRSTHVSSFLRTCILPAIVLLICFLNRAEARPHMLRKSGLSLSVLLTHIERKHPLLRQARHTTQSLKKIADVSGAWPNIQLSYQREQILPSVGQDVAGLQVKVPLGGRTFRKRAWFQMRHKAHQAYTKWLSFRLRLRFSRLYFRKQKLHQKKRLAKRLLQKFKQLRHVLQARIRGGQIAAMELTRFDLEVEKQNHIIQQIHERILSLAQKMALQAGISVRQISRAAATLDRKKTYTHPASVRREHPELNYLKARIAVHQMQTRWAQAKAWPDVSVFLGYLRQEAIQQPDSHGFSVNLGIPLPLFQRNRAGIRQAKLQLSLAKRRWYRKKNWLNKRVRHIYKQLQQSRMRWKRYQQRMSKHLPKLLQSVHVAFRGGASFASFLSTYRSIERYQQFGLTLQYAIHFRTLALEEAIGHVSIR